MSDLPGKKQIAANLELFNVAECAAILGVSRKSVSNWIHSGALPAIRLGPGQRLLRVRRRDLEAFIDQFAVASGSPGDPDEQDHR